MAVSDFGLAEESDSSGAVTGQLSEVSNPQRDEASREAKGRWLASLAELSFPAAVRCFALLAVEAASVALLFWGLAHYSQLPAYALENELPPAARHRLLALLGVAGLMGALGGVGFLVRARVDSAVRFEQLALQLAPLALVGLLPFLFHWRIWLTRELELGLLLCAYGALAHQAFISSFRASEAPGELATGWAQAQRWLARAEPRLPLALVGLGSAAYAGYFAYHTIAYHHSVLTLSWDLGLENNLLWNLVHGGPFMKSSALTGLAGKSSHFGYHATLFAYVIAPFYALWPGPEVLLVFQAVVIAAAAIPLFLFARRRIGTWSACLIAFAYLLYPAVHGANLYDFHYPPLGVFFLWLTLLLVDGGRYKVAAIAALLTLSIREDVAADLAVMGGFIALCTPRVRAGLVIMLVALVYFLGMKLLVMPRFLEGEQSFLEQWQALIPAGERGVRGVLMTVVGNPIFALRTLFDAQKLLYVIQLAAPLAFLPWRRPIGFYLAVPGFFFTLLTVNAPPLIQISFQYTAHWIAFVFVAVVVNLDAVSQPRYPGDAGGGLRKRAWLATIALMTLLASYQYGAVLQQNTARGGFSQYKFGTSEADRERYRQLQALIEQVPTDAKIASSQFAQPHVSNRPDAYYLRLGSFDAEYLLFELPPQRNEIRALQRALSSDFGVMDKRGPFVLARRGHSRERNTEVQKQLR